MNDRGVSSPIGVILILGMTIAAVTMLLVVGGTVINETRADAERSQMENAMSQFSSKASLVGLGESGDQAFDLGRTSEGDVSIRENAGNVSLYVNRTNGDREYIANVSMGSVVYQNGQTELAYQGGGVWKRSNGHSQMVSPPEYHYKLETLTFPIINLTGSGAASGQVQGTVRSDVDTEQLYPNPKANEDFVNPLENGTVYVEIESDYCNGWESFFEERYQGNLEESCESGPENTVVVELSVPFDPAFRTAVTTAGNFAPGNTYVDNFRSGTEPPSATPKVESQISNCVSGGCNESFDDLLVSGTYYTEDANDFRDLTLDTSGGDIDIVVNDTGGEGVAPGKITLDGEHNVSIFVKTDEDFEIDNVNAGGDSTQLITYVHSDAERIRINGNSRYFGGLYAPGSEMTGSNGGCGDNGKGGGGGNIKVEGAIVVDEFCFQSGAAEFSHNPAMVDIDPDLEPNTIKYLHVSENTIEVEL